MNLKKQFVLYVFMTLWLSSCSFQDELNHSEIFQNEETQNSTELSMSQTEERSQYKAQFIFSDYFQSILNESDL